MSEEQDEVLLAVKEEYEKKLQEQREQFELEKKQALEEAEKRHVAQIRALLSGEGKVKREQYEEDDKPKTEERSLYSETLAKLQAKYKI